MASKIKRFLTPATLAVWAVACFCFFQTGFRYHLYYLEQNQLFLCSGAYLAEFFSGPAWFSRMVGEFLQQFYHYAFAGAAILTIALVALGDACTRAFRRVLPERKGKGPRTILALLTALVFITIEARFYLYENAQLASVLSLLAGTWIWILLDMSREWTGKHTGKWEPLVFSVMFLIAGALCYWFFGYGLLAMIVLEMLQPLFRKHVPVAALAAVVCILALASPVSKYYRIGKKEALLYPGAGKWIKLEPARKVETMLKYFHLYSIGDYKEVITQYDKSKEKKFKEQTFIYTLALSQYGMLPDRISSIQEPFIGTSIHLGGGSSFMVSMLMTDLYYLIGDMTYAERGCMHVNNFALHKRSACIIQQLAQIELVSEDYKAAGKYLTMLRKSPVYRKWAIDHTPETMSAEAKAEIEAKKPYINTQAEVRVGDNCRTMLLGLMESNRSNVVAFDYLLCTDLIEGRGNDFLADYAKYGPRDKKLYKELTEPAKTWRR